VEVVFGVGGAVEEDEFEVGDFIKEGHDFGVVVDGWVDEEA